MKVGILKYFGLWEMNTRIVQARFVFADIELIDKWENFSEHFQPMLHRKTLALGFEKATYPFVLVPPLYSRRNVLTSNNI